jgi:hypothetical protein
LIRIDFIFKNGKIGILQDYYQQHAFSDVPNATLYLGFVGSLFLAGLDLASPIAQVLISVWGIRIVLILGTLFIALGLELASLSTEVDCNEINVPFFFFS